VNTRISKGSFRRRWGTAAVGQLETFGSHGANIPKAVTRRRSSSRTRSCARSSATCNAA